MAQVLGGLAGGAILYVIASGQAGFDVTAGFASNGYGEHSPGGHTLTAALVTEVVMTFMFLISIPVTNTSVNPARSTGVALFQGSWAISQLWLFWLAPIVGAALAGVVYNWLGREDQLCKPARLFTATVAQFIRGRSIIQAGGFGCGVCNSPASPILADELHTRHPTPKPSFHAITQSNIACGYLGQGFGREVLFACEYGGSR